MQASQPLIFKYDIVVLPLGSWNNAIVPENGLVILNPYPPLHAEIKFCRRKTVLNIFEREKY